MSAHVLPPAAALASLATLCDFFLEVSLGYLLCKLLTRFSTTPSRRFIIWMAFTITTTVYWLWTVCQASGLDPGSAPFRTQALSSASHTGLLFSLPHPLHWTFPRSLAIWAARALLAASAAYCVVLLLLAFAGLRKRWHLFRALTFRTPVPARIATVFSRVTQDMQVDHCSLWLLAGLPTPATVGWPRASVYLPLECLDDDDASLTNILRHELAHVRRQDSLWEWIARIAKTLVFFHPAVQKASLSLRLERELACDLTVVQSQPDHRDDYANILVRFGWKAAAHPPDAMGIGLAAAPAILHARVQSILAGEPVYSATSRRLRSLFSAGSFGLFLFAAPLLWVGFRLAAANVSLAPQPSTLAATNPAASAARPARRPALNRLPHFAENAPLATAGATQAPPSLMPNLGSAPLPNVRYQSDSPPKDDTAHAEDPDTNATNTQPATPTSSTKLGGVPTQSTLSAAVSAAIALSQLGGHDHDHE